MAAEYRALTAEEKSYFVEVGRLATIAGRGGYKPFGVRKKQKPSNPRQIVSTTETLAVTDAGECISLSLVRSAEQPFSSVFSKFCQDVSAMRPKKPELPAELPTCSIVSNMINAVEGTAHSNSFHNGSSSSTSSTKLHVSHWKPPVAEYAQARNRGLQEFFNSIVVAQRQQCWQLAFSKFSQNIVTYDHITYV